MPQINLIQSGQPVADFSVSGSLITVAGVTVDCGSRQLDVASVIEIRSFGGVAQEGGMRGLISLTFTSRQKSTWKLKSLPSLVMTRLPPRFREHQLRLIITQCQ